MSLFKNKLSNKNNNTNIEKNKKLLLKINDIYIFFNYLKKKNKKCPKINLLINSVLANFLILQILYKLTRSVLLMKKCFV